MPIQQNVKKFQESITQELIHTKDRVRDLIGSANWGVEGAYKEAILRKMIAQFLPSNLSIGTGYILENNDPLYGSVPKCSNQLDILIYNNKIPVLFREGDFVILTPDGVKAVIEVKTKVYINGSSDNSFQKIIEKLDRLKIFPSLNLVNENYGKFIGLFAYDYEGELSSTNIESALKDSSGFVNHISLGPDKFIRYWENTEYLEPQPNHQGRCYIRYNIENLSFSYFISNLLHLTADTELEDRSWFSFPIEGTKEIYRIDPIIPID